MNTIVSTSSSSSLANNDHLLRLGIRLDAAVSGAFGLVLLAGGGLITDLLGMPAMSLRLVSAVCLAYAAVLVLVQSRAAISPTTGWTVVVANSAWVVASILLVEFGWLPLTPLGVGFVFLQAVVVGGLAYLQWAGLRRVA